MIKFEPQLCQAFFNCSGRETFLYYVNNIDFMSTDEMHSTESRLVTQFSNQ